MGRVEAGSHGEALHHPKAGAGGRVRVRAVQTERRLMGPGYLRDHPRPRELRRIEGKF